MLFFTCWCTDYYLAQAVFISLGGGSRRVEGGGKEEKGVTESLRIKLFH